MILNLDSHLNHLESFPKILIPGTHPQTNDIKISTDKAQQRVFSQSDPNDFKVQPQLRTTILSTASNIKCSGSPDRTIGTAKGHCEGLQGEGAGFEIHEKLSGGEAIQA